MNNASMGVVNLRFAHALMKDDKDQGGSKTWIAWIIAAILLLIIFGFVLYLHPWNKKIKSTPNVEKS